MNYDPTKHGAGSPTGPRLLRICQVQERLQCSRSTLFQLFAEKRLPRVKLGASTRVRADALESYINGLPSSTGEVR